MPTKLIEVALPLDVINREAAREKSIRHGHPSTLHLWWARRPLAACRAVLFAQLVDDPSAHPELFPNAGRPRARAATSVRHHRDGWSPGKLQMIRTSRRGPSARFDAAIRMDCQPLLIPSAVAARSLSKPNGSGSSHSERSQPGRRPDHKSLGRTAVDLRAPTASPPALGHDTAGTRKSGEVLQGLADDVRFYGNWMRDEAGAAWGTCTQRAYSQMGSKQLSSRGYGRGRSRARTLLAARPCPLCAAFGSARRRARKRGFARCPIRQAKRVRFEIGHGSRVHRSKAPSAARARLPGLQHCCSLAYVRDEGRAAGSVHSSWLSWLRGRASECTCPAKTRMNKPPRSRCRLSFQKKSFHDQPATSNRPSLRNDAPHADLFTNRQLTALCTLQRSRQGSPGPSPCRLGGDRPYADAVATYLAFTVDKLADLANALAGGSQNAECPRQLFGRQAIPMVWDFGEGNPFSDAPALVGTYGKHAPQHVLGPLRVRATLHRHPSVKPTQPRVRMKASFCRQILRTTTT